MRFGPFVETCMASRMFGKHEEIMRFAPHIRGGWEVWAQIETASEAAARENNFNFHREVRFPHSTQICDFVLAYDDAQSRKIWVELKVQLTSGVINLFTRFANDYDKVNNLIQSGTTFGEYDSGGVSALAIDHASDFVSYALTRVPSAERGRFRVCGYRPTRGEKYFGSLADISKHGVSNSDMMVLWSEMIGKSAEAEVRDSGFVFNLGGGAELA